MTKEQAVASIREYYRADIAHEIVAAIEQAAVREVVAAIKDAADYYKQGGLFGEAASLRRLAERLYAPRIEEDET